MRRDSSVSNAAADTARRRGSAGEDGRDVDRFERVVIGGISFG
jgi:hypothetical protein